MHTSKAIRLACPALRDPREHLMQTHRLTLAVLALFLLAAIAPKLHAQSTTTDPAAINAPITQATANDARTGDSDDDAAPRWPMRVAVPQGVVTIYQPQLTGFENDRLTGRAAFSLMPLDAAKAADEADADAAPQPIFGALWLSSRVTTDRAARTVRIMDVDVTRVHLPSPDADAAAPDSPSAKALGAALAQAFREDPMVLSLDQLIAMLDQVEKDAQAVRDIRNAPPKVVFVNQPAVLVQFDGEPRFAASQENGDLLQAVNTPFFVVMDKRITRYYLKGAGSWYIAREATGPYLNIAAVPAEISRMATSQGYVDPEEAMADAQDAGQIDAPAIITATEPTELVWTLGTEELSPIENTNLLYVTNTDSDIILDIDSQQIYLLLSGRWYRASSRNGPWTYIAPDNLPADFARIPTDSDKGSVLAHVAGTQMARDAIADSYVPQTATIDRANYQQPSVEYDGNPRFEPIENLAVTYAVNTPNAVLYINNRYYVCYNAVWYESAFAQGPWDLCVSVPREVYLIPPTVPVYPVRYVRIYDVTPTVIYTGYLPGYVGCYTYGGTVVYGTGYHYRPWYGQRFYARPYTWGFAPRYDPYHSYWGFSVGINFGNGSSLWFGTSSRSYVTTRSVWFGYGGYRPAYHRHHPRHVWHDRFDRRRDYFDRRRDDIRRDAYRDGYRDARDRFERRDRGPRRADLNLYERRADVIRTATRGRTAIDRDDRVRRVQRDEAISRGENPGRFDRRGDGRDSVADRNDRGDRGDRGDRVNRGDRDDNRANRPERETPGRVNTPRRDARVDDNRAIVRSPSERYQTRGGDAAADENRTGRESNDARAQRDRLRTNGRDSQRDASPRNNLFADEDGNVYRKTLDGWERRENDRWVNAPRSRPENTAGSNRGNATDPTVLDNRRTSNPRATVVTPSDRYRVNRDAQPRDAGSNDAGPGDSRRVTINPWRGSSSREQSRTQTPSREATQQQQQQQQRTIIRQDRSQQPGASSRDPGAVRSTTPIRTTPEAAQPRTNVGIPGGRTSDRNVPAAAGSSRDATRSLNNDYRARVRGQQRQETYQREVAPQPHVVQPRTAQPRVERSQPQQATPQRATPSREAAPQQQRATPQRATPSRESSPRESAPSPASRYRSQDRGGEGR